MRIALVHNLPAGGARRVVHELLSRMVDDHVDVFEISLGRSDRWPQQRAFAPRSGQVRRYAIAHSFGTSPVGLLAAAEQTRHQYSRMAADIDGAEYDVVLVNQDQFTSAPAILQLLKTRSVYLCHEPRRQSFEYDAAHRAQGLSALVRRPYHWIARSRDIAAARAADAILTGSSFAAEGIARAYGRDASVAHLGVDEIAFAPPSDVERGDHVVCVGAIDRLKAQHLAVTALALIPAARRPPLKLVYERADPTYLREVLAHADETNVHLEPSTAVADADLARIYATSRATLCLSRLEPFGLTALESIATGTPVVAVHEGGFRETVEDGVTGALVDREPRVIANAIETLISGAEPDRSRLRRSILPYWSWDAAVRRLRMAILNGASAK